MVALLLVTVVFYAFPTGTGYTLPPIKVGILGPMFWSHGDHMWRAANLAADRINDAGGIAGHELILEGPASTHDNALEDPPADKGARAMGELMLADVDFAQGCFRTESAMGARGVAMDNKIIFTVTGAGTDSLIDTPDTNNVPDTVRGNYERYKYIFRVTPTNDTTLGGAIFTFLAFTMATKLFPLFPGYGSPLKIAVITEAAVWTEKMHGYFSNEDFWNIYLGMGAYGGVDVVYASRESPVDPGWVEPAITTIAGTGARVIIICLAGPVGIAFTSKWGELKPDAALVGIDVPGQLIPTQWELTGGKCETETFLATSGGGRDPTLGTPTNTCPREGPCVHGINCSGSTRDFYNEYYTAYGEAPMYTAYGAYDALMGLNATVSAWVDRYLDFGPGKLHDDPDYHKLIPIIEQTERHGLVGRFKYTGPNPGHAGDYDRDTGGVQPYPYLAENPTKKGTLHDVWSVDLSYSWPTGYVRSHQASWQAGVLEIVFPMDQAYSKLWALPPWMYPYPTDVDQNGVRDIGDIAIVSYAIGTEPGDPRWQYVADYDRNWEITGTDLAPVSYDYGQPVPIPLG